MCGPHGGPRDWPQGPGGGGHSTHILVGMCHDEVKNVGLWSGLSVKMLLSGAGSSGLERENASLWAPLHKTLTAGVTAHFQRYVWELAVTLSISGNSRCIKLYRYISAVTSLQNSGIFTAAIEVR